MTAGKGHSGHLPPDEWYPAFEAGVAAREVRLADGERVRVAEASTGHHTADSDPVLLLHGWGASAYSYRSVLPLLSAAGIRAFAFDLRGHGLSDKPIEVDRYTSPAMVDQVLAVMDALDLTSAVLVGQSMGGALALDAALADPKRVRGVVLAAPIGFAPIRRISVARAVRASEWLPGRVGRWTIALLLARVYGTLREFSERDVDEYWAPAQFAAFSRAIFLLVNAFDWGTRRVSSVRTIADRIRLILGSRDKLVTPHRVVPRAREIGIAPEHVRVIVNSGHLLAEEAPDQVVDAILDVALRRT